MSSRVAFQRFPIIRLSSRILNPYTRIDYELARASNPSQKRILMALLLELLHQETGALNGIAMSVEESPSDASLFLRI